MAMFVAMAVAMVIAMFVAMVIAKSVATTKRFDFIPKPMSIARAKSRTRTKIIFYLSFNMN